MNKVKSFTFYDNYYALLDNLQKEDKLLMLEAIVDYMFKDKEPILEGLNNAIWMNIKMPLDTSKNNSIRSTGKGAPKGNKNAEKTNQKQTKNKPKTNQKQTNNISTFLFLISNFKKLDRGLLRGKIEEWLTYKEERGDIYQEIGLKSLLTQIENNTDKYGETEVINLINECMSNNWKGIIWDKLNGKEKKKVPDWFEKENEKQTINAEEEKELKEIMKSYG